MKLLLLGKDGQVGWELQRALLPLGQVVALGRRDEGGLCGDLERVEDLRQTIQSVKPDVIVNAAAYTAVDRAEAESAAARRINVEAPAALAEVAAHHDLLLVHYSTDYVFNGSGSQPWAEADVPAPINVYGLTKSRGEEEIRRICPRHLIVRTSWVYSAHGKNFIRTLLRRAGERDKIEVVDDQIGAPTGAELIADSTAHAIRAALPRKELCGTYHVTARGETSWFHYARFVVETARSNGWPIRVAADAVVPVTSAAFPTSARRPKNGRLLVEKFEQAFEITLPGWRVGVTRTLTEMAANVSHRGQA